MPALMFLRGLPWLKMIQPLLILTLLATVAFMHNQLGHKKDELNTERTQRGEVAKLIGAEDNWLSIRTHARDLKDSNANMDRALDEISNATIEAKKRADAADKALAREQADNAKKFAKAQKTIEALQNQKSTGTAEGDAKLIDEISKLPWAGFRQQVGIIDPEKRFDYNTMLMPQLYKERAVRLVTYANRIDLELSFQRHYPTVPTKPGWYTKAFVYETKGTCEIHVVDPKVEWNSAKRNTLGHELSHCFYGYWHAEVAA